MGTSFSNRTPAEQKAAFDAWVAKRQQRLYGKKGKPSQADIDAIRLAREKGEREAKAEQEEGERKRAEIEAHFNRIRPLQEKGVYPKGYLTVSETNKGSMAASFHPNSQDPYGGSGLNGQVFTKVVDSKKTSRYVGPLATVLFEECTEEVKLDKLYDKNGNITKKKCRCAFPKMIDVEIPDTRKGHNESDTRTQVRCKECMGVIPGYTKGIWGKI